VYTTIVVVYIKFITFFFSHVLWLWQALLVPTLITFSNRYCVVIQQHKSVITLWNQFSRIVNLKWFCHFSASNLNTFVLRVTHQLYIGVSYLTEKGLYTGLPLITAKILTIVLSATRGKYRQHLRHSTNICAWREHLSYITSLFCCHRFPWLPQSMVPKWHHSHVKAKGIDKTHRYILPSSNQQNILFVWLRNIFHGACWSN
jgi:hypothetical protein